MAKQLEKMTNAKSALLALVFVALVIGTLTYWKSTHPAPDDQKAIAENVGFFSPRGPDERFANKVDFAMVNVNRPDQIATSLAVAKAAGLRLTLDFGPVIATPRPVEKLRVGYSRADASRAEKAFPPRPDNKMRNILPDDELRIVISPYLDLMQTYAGVVDAVFMVDEPYLNGVSKAELERAAKVFRAELYARGLTKVRLGVLFASAMFHAPFAQMIDREAVRYVETADTYRVSVEGTAEGAEWVKTFADVRLTTYDAAGNYYTGGGIPRGYDMVAFDFYLSTLLADTVYDRALDWFSANTDEPACDVFANKTVASLRTQLSFYQSGPVVQGDSVRDKDRVLLDQMFDCRMNATIDLLLQEQAASGVKAEIKLIGESSSNGFLEFDAAGIIEPDQPMALVEARVLDEVDRYLKLLRTRGAKSIRSIAYFTFDDEYDDTINLHILGASSMKGVLTRIFGAAAVK
jgi:hypothetical protein